MKIREGFVSNSSSSSFLIVGRRVDFEQPDVNDIWSEGIDDRILRAVGLEGYPKDSDFVVLPPGEYDPGHTIVGFGTDNGDEYGWNETEKMDEWMKKARALLGDDVKVFFGIVGEH